MGPNWEARRADSQLADSWRRTLSGISTRLGRLEYLASLRNAHSGLYEHFGLAQRVGAEKADDLIRQSHDEVFQQWLALEQADQLHEAESYLESVGGDKRELLRTWLALQPYSGWVPADSRDVERELFLTDMADVLEALRTDYQVASRDPEL